MSTIFFKKKSLYTSIIFIFAVIFCFSTLLYTLVLRYTERIELNKTFYFLVTESTHIQAGAHFVTWSGGAGYLLEKNGRQYATFSVYLSEKDGLSVQTSMLKTGEETLLLPFSIKNLYLKTYKAKKNSEKIKGAFQSLYGCLQVLEQEISRIAKGATQESGKRILEIIQRKLEFLSQEYEKIFPQYATVCWKEKNEIAKLRSDTIFLKDLRYIMCELCTEFYQLTKLFSL